MEEIWRDIKEFEGSYQVSNSGRIKSLDRCVFDSTKYRKQFIKGKILNICDNGNGYKQVHLLKNGKRYVKLVHRLVAEHFLETYSKELDVNHKDFNKANNNISNLEMVTRKENINYSFKNKRHNTTFYDAKKQRKFINKIIELNKAGMTKTDICKKYKCQSKTLNKYIPNLKKWGTTGRSPSGRKIKCLDTGEIFKSIQDANKTYEVTTIGDCCRGRQKTAAGYKWQYV